MPASDYFADKVALVGAANLHKLPMFKPSVTDMRTALQTFSASTYTAAVLNTMTKRDMEYACRLNGLSVAGL